MPLLVFSPRVLYIVGSSSYNIRGEHANHYTTDEPTIYSSWGKHANYYINYEPTIYSTGCEHADYYNLLMDMCWIKGWSKPVYICVYI
jgi:hypothetical protein